MHCLSYTTDGLCCCQLACLFTIPLPSTASCCSATLDPVSSHLVGPLLHHVSALEVGIDPVISKHLHAGMERVVWDHRLRMQQMAAPRPREWHAVSAVAHVPQARVRDLLTFP